MPGEVFKRVGPAEKINTANRFSPLQGLHPPDPPDPPDSPSEESPSPRSVSKVRFDLTSTNSQLNQITKPVDHRLIKLDGTIAGVPAKILLDCGASHLYVNSKFVTKHKLSSSVDSSSAVRLSVTLADGSTKCPAA